MVKLGPISFKIKFELEKMSEAMKNRERWSDIVAMRLPDILL